MAKNCSYFGDENHHFTKNINADANRLLNRLELFYTKGRHFPTDEENMRYFGWTKDHINRCYQLLKAQKLVDYARGHRRTTLQFKAKYSIFNDWVHNKKR